MGFVKGMIAGVLGLTGVVITAAVISVVKDGKKQDCDSHITSDESKPADVIKEFEEKANAIVKDLEKNLRHKRTQM